MQDSCSRSSDASKVWCGGGNKDRLCELGLEEQQ